jgi:protein involved in polysaccharide export with SLBB domain
MPPTVAPASSTEVRTLPTRPNASAGQRDRRALSDAQLQGLKRFGESFFAQSKEELTRYAAGEVPSDYRLAPGDEIAVTTYNVKGGESVSQQVIDQNGDVVLPGAGPVNIAGLTPSEGQSVLDGRMQAILPNMRVKVAMGQLRQMRIFLLGDITRPGGLMVNPGSTFLDALLLGGGPNATGSYRKVQLQRGGQVIATFDLYKFLREGKSSSPKLIEGDRIFVPLVGAQVSIAGAVNRPAVYELNGETTLAQLLRLAGGVLPDADRAGIQLERVTGNSTRSLLDVALKDAGQTRLKAGDIFWVREVLDDISNGISVEGAVNVPGFYPLTQGMTVRAAIETAKGLADGAFSGHAEVYRNDGPDSAPRVIGFDLALAMRGDSLNNLRLQPDDRVMIYDRGTATFASDLVRVEGQVSRPGEYPRYQGMRARDLITQAGGLKPDASVYAEVARQTPDGGLQHLALNVPSLMGSSESSDNLLLQDLDLLVIRKSMNTGMWPAFVTIEGEVAHPGVYPIDPRKDTMASVLARAGGLTPQAYPQGAFFVRRKGEIVFPEREEVAELVYITTEIVARQIAAVEAEANNATAAALRMKLANAALDETSLATVPRVINRILATTRVPIDLAAVAATGTTDPGVRDGDVLLVPARPTTVMVAGAVNLPMARVYKPGISAGDYIKGCGGRSKDAATGELFLMRANGEMWQIRESNVVEAGDVILVPPAAIVAEPGAWEKFLQVFQVAVGGVSLYRLIDR